LQHGNRRNAKSDILGLLKVARDKNARLGVTGLLVYQKRTNEFFEDFRRIEESHF
jgi:hypothetical protein